MLEHIGRKRTTLALLLVSAAPVALAGGLQAEFHVGLSMPTFEETLTYDPSTQIPATPGVTVVAQGPLTLDAKGDLSFSGGLTFFFAGPLGLEGRVDGLTADLEATGARYDVRVAAQPPLPAAQATLELTGRDLRLERVQPFSLNLRLLTPGAVRFSLSGGVSYLGTLRIGGTLAGSLEARLGSASLPITLAEVGLAASAPPGEADDGQWGVNAGLGLQIPLGKNLALSAEARGFLFRDRTLTWSAAAPPRNAIEEAVQRELLARLEPLVFTPTFFSVNAGLALRF